MNPLALILFICCASAILIVERRWAPVPLLVGCCYMTLGQGVDLGPISLPMFRMLAAVGLLRIFIRREGITGGLNQFDKILLVMSSWIILASFFHDSSIPGAGPVYVCGFLFNIVATYFLIRVWTESSEEIVQLLKILAVILAPVAISMTFEKLTLRNPFALFGGINEEVIIREGKARAQGPFRHPILAGTVGATVIPLFVGILRSHKSYALIGGASGLLMTITSASSGPLMSLFFGIFALGMWYMRMNVKMLVWLAFGCYTALLVVMERPPYYLISRIDLTGGSTGWHRAFLIEQTLKHMNEWWLFGTDYTRHWMPDQGAVNSFHTDVTNYYIHIGVIGGLLPVVCLIALIIKALKSTIVMVNRTIIQRNDQILIWALGAGMFSHAATSISIAYFDQSVLFFWLNLALISSLASQQLTRINVSGDAGN